MVKILSNGDIVPDDDPRATQATSKRKEGGTGNAGRPRQTEENERCYCTNDLERAIDTPGSSKLVDTDRKQQDPVVKGTQCAVKQADKERNTLQVDTNLLKRKAMRAVRKPRKNFISSVPLVNILNRKKYDTKSKCKRQIITGKQKKSPIFTKSVLKCDSSTKLRKQYSRASLEQAYLATQAGMSVYRAARLFLVPESTLRDRTRGKVSLAARSGFERMLSDEEEHKFMEDLKHLKEIGYSYTKVDVQHLAAKFAVSCGKKGNDKPFSSNWFYSFRSRWPDLQLTKSQNIPVAAKLAFKELIKTHFKEDTVVANCCQESTKQNADEVISQEDAHLLDKNPNKDLCNKNKENDAPMEITKAKRRQYCTTDLQKAYLATQAGMSVYRASRQFSIPESTLRDRTKGNVTLKAKPGSDKMFSDEEEKHFVEYLRHLGKMGYTLTKCSLQDMASEFAVLCGKKQNGDKPLSHNWFYGFVNRWPELQFSKSRLDSLAISAASKHLMRKYFQIQDSILINSCQKDTSTNPLNALFTQ